MSDLGVIVLSEALPRLADWKITNQLLQFHHLWSNRSAMAALAPHYRGCCMTARALTRRWPPVSKTRHAATKKKQKAKGWSSSRKWCKKVKVLESIWLFRPNTGSLIVIHWMAFISRCLPEVKFVQTLVTCKSCYAADEVCTAANCSQHPPVTVQPLWSVKAAVQHHTVIYLGRRRSLFGCHLFQFTNGADVWGPG